MSLTTLNNNVGKGCGFCYCNKDNIAKKMTIEDIEYVFYIYNIFENIIILRNIFIFSYVFSYSTFYINSRKFDVLRDKYGYYKR